MTDNEEVVKLLGDILHKLNGIDYKLFMMQQNKKKNSEVHS